MTVVTWILSVLLAVAFVGAGAMKLTTSKAKLAENPRMGWTTSFTEGQIKGIAALEVLGGLGVVLPWLTGVAKVLTPLAALGLAVIMVGALVTHARRGELKDAGPVNGGLLLLAVVVCVLRFSQL